MKEKLSSALGIFGIVLYYLILLAVGVLPFVMINISSSILRFILFFLYFIFPSSSIIFWIWGFVCAICGPQDWLAILYYILFGVMFLPFFFDIVRTLLSSLSKHRD